MRCNPLRLIPYSRLSALPSRTAIQPRKPAQQLPTAGKAHQYFVCYNNHYGKRKFIEPPAPTDGRQIVFVIVVSLCRHLPGA